MVPLIFCLLLLATEEFGLKRRLFPLPPAALPLLGAGAAFGFSRQLRKRIKLAPAPLGSALPLA